MEENYMEFIDKMKAQARQKYKNNNSTRSRRYVEYYKQQIKSG